MVQWVDERWRRLWGRGRFSQEAGEALFRGLRTRLTLWYCGVLGAAIVFFGVLLYIGAQYFLLTPIYQSAAGHARAHVNQWVTDSMERACNVSGPFSHEVSPPFPENESMREMVVCFDQHGSVAPGTNTTGLGSAFFSNTLAKAALQTGQVKTDSVDAGGTARQVYRYAQAVANPNGGGYLGVVMVGESIRVQEGVLTLLLELLLGVGGIALLSAGVGGLFLANRALAPARLAWANQQRFIADASHELRTPLTLLRADVEVLLRGRKQLKEEDVELLEDILAEAKHMASLATNMLTLARLDHRGAQREHEVVHVADVAAEGVRRVGALAEHKEITIQLETSDVALVIGDPTQLEQAVLALLDNAIKYNQQSGSVIVRVLVEKGEALLEVSDTGIGIEAEHLSHLGERFYRVDKARSREAGGTGLGLSIVRGIVNQHGGELIMKSVPGQGTTATIKLPLAQRGMSGER